MFLKQNFIVLDDVDDDDHDDGDNGKYFIEWKKAKWNHPKILVFFGYLNNFFIRNKFESIQEIKISLFFSSQWSQTFLISWYL